MKNNKGIWIASVAAVLVIAAVAIGWQMKPVDRPSPDSSDAVTLAKFANSSDFKALPENDKRPYRAVMRTKMKEIAAALKAGQITRNQYDQAYLNVWLERQLDHMKEYYTLPAATREKVWTDQLRKKNAEKAAKKSSQTSDDPQPTDDAEDDFLDQVIATWSPEERTKFEDFRKANKSAKSKVAGK